MRLTIGVTGHRILAEPDKVTAGVDQALDHIAQAFPGRPWTVVSCEVLLAIWDGQGAQGQGGTGAIVAQARHPGAHLAGRRAGEGHV